MIEMTPEEEKEALEHQAYFDKKSNMELIGCLAALMHVLYKRDMICQGTVYAVGKAVTEEMQFHDSLKN